MKSSSQLKYNATTDHTMDHTKTKTNSTNFF